VGGNILGVDSTEYEHERHIALARMSELLYGYQKIDPTTWAYLSSLLMIGLYFKFSRFWSVRNLDLVLIILLAPGLLLVHRGQEFQHDAEQILAAERSNAPQVATPPEEREANRSPMLQPEQLFVSVEDPKLDKTPGENLRDQGRNNEYWGFLLLFVAGGLLMVRLLADPTMVRRPLLEPNLSPGGLTFVGCSLFVFLIANAITNDPAVESHSPTNSPGYALLQGLPVIPPARVSDPPETAIATAAAQQVKNAAVTKTLVVVANLVLVLAMVGIGWRHFDNMKMGIGAATLYLMLPYTAQMTGDPHHVVPGALLLCAVLCYRRPLTAGLFLGLAASVGYYPLYLLPLWLSFYWQRGLMRFISGALIMASVMAIALYIKVTYFNTGETRFLDALRQMFGIIPFRMNDLHGIWGLGWDRWYRVPMLAAFVVLMGSFALWPAQKNLGTLLSCSAAVMLGAQFWNADGGGLYMAWYMPLLLLTVFRPNLEDRVALSVLGEGWFPKRRYAPTTLDRAA
jgi:hypothetical protein